MSDQHQDDRLDELLREAARDYNPPPATPRELMWSRIEARRRGLGTGDLGLGIPASGADPDVIPLRRPARRHWVRWAVGIAAALVLGFGLGRWGRTAGSASGDPEVASIHTPASSALPESTVKSEPAPIERDVAVASTPDETTVAPSPHSRQRAEPRSRGGMRREAEVARSEHPVPSPESRVPSAAYNLAAIQHLTQAEALLTSLRAETRGGKEMDAQLSAWANDLLVSTRLLLDSPAGGDPRMRRLLEDLELVLAQIAQIGAQRAGDERNLIDEAVEGRNVLPRLRTTIPAGVRPVGS